MEEKEIQTETPAEETVEKADTKTEKKCKKANKQVDALKEKIEKYMTVKIIRYSERCSRK